MRGFAVVWPDENFVQGVLAQLPWSTHRAMQAAGARSSTTTGRDDDYVWGRLIRLEEVVAGDVLQFRNFVVTTKVDRVVRFPDGRIRSETVGDGRSTATSFRNRASCGWRWGVSRLRAAREAIWKSRPGSRRIDAEHGGDAEDDA